MATLDPNALTGFCLLSETVTVGGTAVAAHRFINRAGAYPSSGAYAAGATKQAGVANRTVAIDTDGITIAEVGAAISTIDTALFVDAAGKVRPVASTEYQVGRALDTATGTGVEFVRVKLTPR